MWDKIKKYLYAILGAVIGVLFGVACLFKRQLNKAKEEIKTKEGEITRLEKKNELQIESNAIQSNVQEKLNQIKTDTAEKLNGETN